MKQERIIPQRATYTTKEAAAYLKVSVRTIRNFITRGLLRKSNALRRRNLIRGDDVETFLAATWPGRRASGVSSLGFPSSQKLSAALSICARS